MSQMHHFRAANKLLQSKVAVKPVQKYHSGVYKAILSAVGDATSSFEQVLERLPEEYLYLSDSPARYKSSGGKSYKSRRLDRYLNTMVRKGKLVAYKHIASGKTCYAPPELQVSDPAYRPRVVDTRQG